MAKIWISLVYHRLSFFFFLYILSRIKHVEKIFDNFKRNLKKFQKPTWNLLIKKEKKIWLTVNMSMASHSNKSFLQKFQSNFRSLQLLLRADGDQKENLWPIKTKLCLHFHPCLLNIWDQIKRSLWSEILLWQDLSFGQIYEQLLRGGKFS